ncbi:MAG: TIGR03667 family PPOX class F420-dependent oxidoreductase [Pseudonocardiales bacterium]
MAALVDDVFSDPDSEFGRRVRARLRDERLAWLTTVGADGTPQPNPVWFLWAEPAAVLVYNMSSAARLAHIAGNPRVSLHLDGDGQGGDIVVLTGRAEVAPHLPPPHEHPEYLAKYGDAMARVRGSREAFSTVYSVAVILHVERVRGH